MSKFLLVLAVGVAIGYGYGFSDAQVHEQNLFQRLVERIGDETRARMGSTSDTAKASGERQ